MEKFESSVETSSKVIGVILTVQCDQWQTGQINGCMDSGVYESGSVDASGRHYDFLSRYFAPWMGLPEDPVCGKERVLQNNELFV